MFWPICFEICLDEKKSQIVWLLLILVQIRKLLLSISLLTACWQDTNSKGSCILCVSVSDRIVFCWEFHFVLIYRYSLGTVYSADGFGSISKRPESLLSVWFSCLSLSIWRKLYQLLSQLKSVIDSGFWISFLNILETTSTAMTRSCSLFFNNHSNFSSIGAARTQFNRQIYRSHGFIFP